MDLEFLSLFDSVFEAYMILVEIIGIKGRFPQTAPLFYCGTRNRGDCGSYGGKKLCERFSDATSWTEGCDRYAYWIRGVSLKLMLLISYIMDLGGGAYVVNTSMHKSVYDSR